MTDKKIEVCLAGFGNFGKKLFSYLEKMPEFLVRYIYHPNQEKSAQYGPLGTSDIHCILNDPNLEAVIIATPHDQHVGLLEPLLLLGRHHVFVEKPMTAVCEEALALEQVFLAYRKRKVFMVGHNQRREAVFRKAKELLDKKAIGSVVDVSFNFSHGGVYNIDPGNWRCDKKRTREGPLITLGSHAIDTIHYLFGPVRSVCATIRNVSGRTTAPDCSAALMSLDNNVVVSLHVNYNVPSEKRCVISGTEGVIYIDRDRIFLRLGRDVNRVPTKKEKLTIASVDTVQEELQEFSDAILNGKKVETGFAEGAAVMKVLEACYDSSLTHTPRRLSL